jgi:hypothetical protein
MCKQHINYSAAHQDGTIYVMGGADADLRLRDTCLSLEVGRAR